nr:hypothetical protein SGCNGUUO_SGCNGUUO_CDS_0007 [Microvirus sp.]
MLKINISARAVIRVRVFVLLYCASIRNDRIRQPSPLNSIRKASIPMKNTSLFVSFWAMPERKPSAEPTE